MNIFKKLFLIVTVFALFSACSSDDNNDSTPPTNNPPTDNSGNYFPLTEGDEWNYDVAYTDNNDSNNNTNSTDRLFVESSIGSTYTLGVNDNNIANGTMNAILTSGTLERTESTLILDGSIALPFPGFDSSIDFSDMVLYDLNAANNTQLTSTSGSISQEVDAGGSLGTVTLTIDYTLSTSQLDNNASVTVNGVDYTMVSKASSKMNMSISLPSPLGTIFIIQNQDVTDATNYFVENIGLVKSDTAIEYQVSQSFIDLIELGGGTIPFPTSGSATNVQTLTDYMVTIE